MAEVEATSMSITRLDEDGQPDGEPQYLTGGLIDLKVTAPIFEDGCVMDLSTVLREFTFTMDLATIDVEYFLVYLGGFTPRKARRCATRAARRQRHLGYQTSRKIRRRNR